MKIDYLELLKLLSLLKIKVSIVKDKYKDLNVDEIKYYELENDIKVIEDLVDAISFKKHKIMEQMFDEYVKEYEREFQEQEMVINNG